VDDMRELVTVEQVEGLFRALAVAGPLVGVALGAALGSRRGVARNGALNGLGIGSLAVLNYGLWRMFTALTERNGLDSVANLLLNLGIFIGLGLIGGILYARWARRGDAVSGDDPREGGDGGQDTRSG